MIYVSELELQVLGPEELNKSRIVYEPEDKSDVFILPSDMLKDNKEEGKARKNHEFVNPSKILAVAAIFLFVYFLK